MKKWLLIIFLLPLFAKATVQPEIFPGVKFNAPIKRVMNYPYASAYWVSAAGSDSNNGLDINHPFQTLAKLQTVLTASTTVNLRRGDVFPGSLSVPASCIIQGYSTGANPVISGFDDLTVWTSLGGNKYRSNDPSLLATLKVFTLGGSQRAVARFPRTSYATYTSFSGTTGTATITSAGLSGTYTGQVQVVIKKNHFDMQTYSVSSVTGAGVVTYTGAGGNSPTNGYGAFLQNANEFLVAPGDWVYDGSGNVTVYSTGGAPSNVKVSRVKDVITVTGNSVIINGIDVQGANEYGIYTNNRSSTIIENCNITLCDVGIYQNNATGAITDNCTFNFINGNAITHATSLNNTITNCTVTNAGMIQGAATEYSGIRVIPISARNTTITGTTVSFCGYNGFFIEGSFNANHLIGFNCLNNLDDGGIFYSGIGHSPSILPASTLTNSIFYNAIGAPLGTSNGTNQAVAIYLDDYMNHVTVSNCVGYNAGEYVFFSHNNQDIVWSNNLGYNGAQSVWAGIHDNLGGKLSNITLSNNQFINATGYINILRSIAPDALPADLTNFGVASNNHYGNNVTVANPFQTQLYSQPVQNLTFAGWKSATGQDGSSSYQTIPSPSALYPNPTSTSTTTTLSAVYKDLLGNSYSGVTSIAAYSALYLYFFGSIPPSPPSISYVPSSYTFYINTPIGSPILPVNVGGTFSTASIDAVQPSGLLFGTSDASFSGTPLALSPSHTYHVQAVNGGGTSTAPITIAVIDHAPVVSYNNSPQTATINVAMTPMSPTLVSGGSVVSYSVSPALPTGITLSAGGVVSGVPTVLSAQQNYVISCTNSGGTYPVTISLGVTNPAPVAPHIVFSPNTYILPINVLISTISPVSTGGSVASFSISPSLPGNLVFSTSLGTVTGTPIGLQSPVTYSVTAHNATADYSTPLTLSVITVTPPPPVPAYSPAIRTLQRNVSMSVWTPTNSGGFSSNWTVSPALPSNLVINSVNGQISGIPSSLLPLSTFRVFATNAGGTNHFDIQITIVDPAPTPVIRVRTNKTPHFINRH